MSDDDNRFSLSNLLEAGFKEPVNERHSVTVLEIAESKTTSKRDKRDESPSPPAVKLALIGLPHHEQLLAAREAGLISDDPVEAYKAGFAQGQKCRPAASDNGSITTIDEELESFRLWQTTKSAIFSWPDSEMDRLRDAVKPGDKIRGVFAYSCEIIRANGVVEIFERGSRK